MRNVLLLLFPAINCPPEVSRFETAEEAIEACTAVYDADQLRYASLPVEDRCWEPVNCDPRSKISFGDALREFGVSWNSGEAMAWIARLPE